MGRDAPLLAQLRAREIGACRQPCPPFRAPAWLRSVELYLPGEQSGAAFLQPPALCLGEVAEILVEAGVLVVRTTGGVCAAFRVGTRPRAYRSGAWQLQPPL